MPFVRMNAQGEDEYRNLLNPIAAAYDAMPISMLARILGYDLSNEKSRDSFQRVIERSALILNTSDTAVRFVHKSCKDWLCGPNAAKATVKDGCSMRSSSVSDFLAQIKLEQYTSCFEEEALTTLASALVRCFEEMILR